jgi:hypothetical protein
MATFELTAPDGGTYHVDAPDQNAALAAFSAFHGAKPSTTPAAAPADKYQQAAIDEQATLKNKGIDEGAGLTRRLAHGATLGADSTIMAGLTTPMEMIKHGTFNPAEGYNYAKAREDQIMGDARKNTGIAGDAAEILGGGVAGAGLAKGGITAANFLGPEAGLLGRTAASAADAAGVGAVSGAMEGNGLQERGANALKGGAVGLLAGGALPLAAKAAGMVTSPIVSQIRARINPEGYAQSQVARGIHDSGIMPDQISHDVMQALNDGQGQFTVADAMGNAGQRLLSTVARAPGAGRTAVVDTLERRQAGQGRDVSNALQEGFGNPQTAAQTEARLTTARGAQGDIDFGAARAGAQPVNVTNVLDHIDQRVAPFGVPHDRVSPDGITGRLLAYRRMLGGTGTELDGSAAGGLNDFNAAQLVRHDLSDEVQAAVRAGQGNKARLLGGVLRQLDTSLENSSAGFRQANANFAQASRNIEAVGQGRNASMRGRTEDTIPAFQALPAEGQTAYRAGYVDPLIASTQAAAPGVNKARPLLNDAFRDEAAVIAPGNEQMQRRLTRSNTMFETRRQATGGSGTVENMADEKAMASLPGIIGHLAHGNIPGAVRGLLHAGADHLTGNTPAVREQVGRILLQNGNNLSPTALREMVDRTVRNLHFAQNLARNIGRGASGGLAVAAPASGAKQNK